MKKKKRAPGGGRKLKYGELVVKWNIKLPDSKADELKKQINKLLEKYVVNQA